MATRVVYGRTHSENGWVNVDQGSCTWVRIPGAEHVSIQVQNGQPLVILRAFLADWHAYIEPIRDADTACWTATNSVPSSNHLSGTACDVNWNSHPFRVNYAGFSPAMISTMREMLDFYEKTVFWGQDWNSPKDTMHVQMGYDTFMKERTQSFIDRKIRADGFSSFRRTGAPPPPAPPPPLSRADQYALEVKREGERRGITPRGIQIAFSVCFVESNWKMYANSNVPESLKYPHDAVGSDHDSVGLFQQRHPMWGPLDVLMNAAKSAGLFYDRLAKMNYNDPNRRPGDFAADVQRPAAQYRGRYQERFGEAVSLYNKLSGTAPPAPPGEDELSAEAERQIAELHGAFFGPFDFESLSPLKHPGQGKVGNLLEFIRWMDSNIHVIVEILLVKLRYPDPDAVALLRGIVATTDPERERDRKLAKAILLEMDQPSAPPQTAAVPVQSYTPAAVEVLPAVVERPAPVSQNTPAELLDTLDRLKIFNEAYRERFEALTEGEEDK